MPNFTKISDFALWRVSLLVFNREYLTAIRLVLCRWWWSVKCAKCWWIFPCQSNFPDSIHLTSIFSREENAYKFQFSPAPRLHARHEYSGYPRNEAYGFCAAIKNRRERALNRKRRPEATTVIIQILPVLTARNGFKRIIRARKHQSPPVILIRKSRDLFFQWPEDSLGSLPRYEYVWDVFVILRATFSKHYKIVRPR